MRPNLSLAERDRRWAEIQVLMRTERLDAIVVGMTDARGQKGAFRYLSDERPFHRFGYVVMPQAREPIVVLHPVLAYAPRGMWIADVRTPADPGAELAAILRASAAARIGVIGADHAFRRRDYDALIASGAELVDCDTAFEMIRSRKSAEEIAALEEASAIADACFGLLLDIARPGMTEAEIGGRIAQLALAKGADELLFLTMSGSARGAVIRAPGDTVLEAKSPFIFSIELTGPSGFWVELARIMSFAEDETAREIADLAQQSVIAARNILREGVRGSAVQAALESAFDSAAWVVAGGSGHAIGQDVIEQPMIARGAAETMTFGAGMALAMHPMFHSIERPVAGYVADTYILESGGPRALSRWPLDLYRR